MTVSEKTKNKKKMETIISLPNYEVTRVSIPIVNLTPLIMHKWSQKAITEIEGKHKQVAKTAKGKRDFEAEFEATIYYDSDGDLCFPSIAFKKAMVRACSLTDGIPMTVARIAFFVCDEYVKLIKTTKPEMRVDPVRNSNGGADIRARAQINKWEANLSVEFNTAKVSADQIYNLVNIAGMAVGIGEWRPEKTGNTFGRFVLI